MWDLIPFMIERIGIIVMIAFLITRLKAFQQIVHQESDWKVRITMMLVFGAFGIISTHTGVIVTADNIVTGSWNVSLPSEEHALANTRNVGVVMGGLLGGPAVGLGVGLIAGAHRFLLGGFTGLACSVSTVIGGILAGWIGWRLRKKGTVLVKPGFALLFAMLIEGLQMLTILLLAKPYTEALKLVQLISLPMIVINGFGVCIFVLIIQSVLNEQERIKAIQTQKALYIADQTLPYFRQGLGIQSCQKAAEVIYKLTQADAIAITDRFRILTHVGAGSDHHSPLQPVSTKVTRKVLQTGETAVVRSREEIDCMNQNCSLQVGIVLPLKINGEILGTLKLYFKDPRQLSTVEQQLAEGLVKLICTQLELGEAEKQSKLLKDAKLKALQAQVHPHFLFNALNTIVSFCRTDAMLARKQLLHLSTFFRNNLQGAKHTLIPVAKEMEHVEAYFSLEQARYPGRYLLEKRIEPDLVNSLIPPFTLQPLVENAVHHGLKGIRKGGRIEIEIRKEGDQHLFICVRDNGRGISENLIHQLGKKVINSKNGTGTALQNIRERLSGLFGSEGKLEIESNEGGTEVKMLLPLSYSRGEEYAEGIYSRRRAASS